MLLVAAALLALAIGIDVILQSAIPATVQIVLQGIIDKIDIIAEDADRHHTFDGCRIPVPVREWSEVVKYWKKHAPEEICCSLNLCLAPSRARVSNQLSRIGQLESTERGTQDCIGTSDLLESRSPSVQNADRCLRIRVVASYAPHQSALIRRIAVIVEEVDMHGGIAANHGDRTARHIGRLRVRMLPEGLKAR